jgi:hypothetical protein
MIFTIWKTRHKVDENEDYFSYSLKREGYFPLTLTANQLSMLLPTVKTELIPEAPETGTIEINGELV